MYRQSDAHPWRLYIGLYSRCGSLASTKAAEHERLLLPILCICFCFAMPLCSFCSSCRWEMTTCICNHAQIRNPLSAFERKISHRHYMFSGLQFVITRWRAPISSLSLSLSLSLCVCVYFAFNDRRSFWLFYFRSSVLSYLMRVYLTLSTAPWGIRSVTITI